jgi:hypothetical protein
MFLMNVFGFFTQRLDSKHGRNQFLHHLQSCRRRYSLQRPSQSLGSDGGVKTNASSSFGIPILKFGTLTHAGSLSDQVQLL